MALAPKELTVVELDLHGEEREFIGDCLLGGLPTSSVWVCSVGPNRPSEVKMLRVVCVCAWARESGCGAEPRSGRQP